MDIKHFYIEKGVGDVLLLLHGNNESSDYFAHQISEFSKSMRVIAIDTRGHGNTPWGNAPFTISQFADDLCAFMEKKSIKKAHILGFSDGANIAMVFAIRYPHMVDKLILNGGNLYGSGVKASVQLPVVLGYIAAGFLGLFSKKAKKEALMLRLMVRDPALTTADISAIKAKTLVIAGDDDMIKASHTELIAHSIEGAHLATVKGDHFVAGNNPAEFNAAVAKFLAEE